LSRVTHSSRGPPGECAYPHGGSRRVVDAGGVPNDVLPFDRRRYSDVEPQEVPASATRVVRNRQELWVRAMLENARPKPTTKLRVAPYFNVNGEDGLTAKERCDRRKMPESRQFHIGSRRSFRVNSRIRRAVGGSPPILADSWDCGRVYREAENRFPSSTWLQRTRRSWSSQRVNHD